CTEQRWPGGRHTEDVRDALGVIGERALLILPGGERLRHLPAALAEHRERKPVHHGAAPALPEIRRQRVRGIADDGDTARRPALQLDQLETIIAPVIAEPVD